MSRVTLHIAVACCVLAGCGADEEDAGATTLQADSVTGDSVFAPPEERVSLPTSRIYYTLTNHDWYARGESLIHDGRPYDPQGMPISASLSGMTQAGSFQGVDYYVRGEDVEPAVYVPVFEGYWQRFLADPSAAAAPADVADDSVSAPPDPDSTAATYPDPAAAAAR